METRINWKQGEGVIVAVYTGDGSGSLSFSSSTVNEDIDREQSVQLTSKDAPLDVEVRVRQRGLREPLSVAPSDNDSTPSEFSTSDGSLFAVLKQQD